MEDFSDLEDYVNVVRSKIQTMLEKLEEAKNLNQELDQVIRFIFSYLVVFSTSPDNDVYIQFVTTFLWSYFFPDNQVIV